MKKRTSITLTPELLKWCVPYLRSKKTSLSAMVNDTILKLSSSVSEEDKSSHNDSPTPEKNNFEKKD